MAFTALAGLTPTVLAIGNSQAFTAELANGASTVWGSVGDVSTANGCLTSGGLTGV